MTQISSPVTTAFQLRIPSGIDVYDALMSAIDEDLLTDNIPHLDEKYQGEIPRERGAIVVIRNRTKNTMLLSMSGSHLSSAQ
jgi:hypothetical protein